MTRATIPVWRDADRERAARWAMQAPVGTRIEFKAPKRSIPQNDRMWAMLTDVATQLPWHGIKLSPDDWKLIFLDALKRELRMVPNIDGSGFVNLGRSSSDLSKAEMIDLMTLIEAFGASHNIVFHDQVSLSPSIDGEARPETVECPPASTVSGNLLVPA